MKKNPIRYSSTKVAAVALVLILIVIILAIPLAFGFIWKLCLHGWHLGATIYDRITDIIFDWGTSVLTGQPPIE